MMTYRDALKAAMEKEQAIKPFSAVRLVQSQSNSAYPDYLFHESRPSDDKAAGFFNVLFNASPVLRTWFALMTVNLIAISALVWMI